MKWPLNQAQNEAVTQFATDILVTAGAGTGKTRVLTQKYLRLLEERRASVPEIVAITFTKKAALEMRERIQSGLRELLEEAAPSETEYWQKQLTWLENARITTFHSFCLGLIREYPLEAGVGPVDRIFGEAEETIYLQQVIETVFYELMQERDFPTAQLSRILTDFGWETMAMDLSAVYRCIRETGNPFVAVIAQTKMILDEAIQQSPYRMEHLIDAVEEILHGYTALKLTERALDIFAKLQGDWAVYRDTLKSGNILGEILPVLAALRRALPRNLPKIVKEQVEEVHHIAEALELNFLDREALERLPVYGALLERIDRHYTALKLELGALDFADQIILARNLMRDYPDLNAEVRSGIRYLLVDEFQDTNPLQMELVTLLTREPAENQSPGTGFWMAVGDIKQSIYRFRGADATIIQTLAETFRGGRGQVIALAENYRSAPLLIRFINEIATPLFATEDFEYDPLVPSGSPETAGIELLWTGSNDRRLEAAAIASRIQELVRDTSGDERPLSFGDIVILFRAATAMEIYQHALQNAGIPFYTASGGSFYRCQEVVDQLNLLRLVEQGFDGVALLGLLSSPYVGLSYESLLWLGEGKNLADAFYEEELSERAQRVISLPEQERLIRFREILLGLRSNRTNMRIPDILRSALQQTDYEAILWTMPDAARRLANLEKLQAKAEEFCAQGFHDLAAFLEYIKKLEEAEVLEGEAPTQAEAGNAVRLMTIHRAKGLEFPVVFIADLDRQFRFGNKAGLVYHQETGLGFPIKLANHETGRPSTLERFKAMERRAEIAELKRLLYVALTRAKQQLLLVGSGKSRSKGGTLETAGNWMKWFEILLELHGEETAVDYRGIELTVRRNITLQPERDKPSRFLEEVKTYLRRNEEIAPEIRVVSENQAAPALETVRHKTLQLNVSELLSFKKCPRRYFWEYQLRLDPVVESEELNAGSSFGSVIGNFFHQAIRSSQPEWPAELWLQNFGHLPEAEQIGLKADLFQMWQNYRQSEFNGLDKQCWDEVPFVVEISPGLRVEGRWDRMMQDSDGTQHLVDFKTHRASRSELPRIALSYHWQLQLYAIAIRQIWQRLPEKASLYFPFHDQILDVPLDQASLTNTVAETTRIGEFIAAQDNWRAYPATGDCRACGYRPFCEMEALSPASKGST